MAEQHSIIRRPIALMRYPAATWYRAFAERRFVFAWVTLTAYSAALMIAFIDSRSVWLDEAISVSISSLPYHEMLAILRHVDAVHGLYYSLLHVWLYLGHGAIAIRLLSAVFACLATLAIGTLAKSMFGEPAAPAAVAVLATSEFFLFYADEARGTALALLACSLAALSLWRAIRQRSAVYVFAAVLCAVGAVYANFVSVLFLAALCTSLIVVRLNRNATLIAIGAVAATVIASVPLLLLIQANSLGQIDWIVRSNLLALFNFGAGILGGDGEPGRLGRACHLLEAAAVLTLMMIGIIGGWSSREARPPVIMATSWFVLPLALGVAVDHFIQPILLTRYFSFALIPAALLAGNGLVRIARTTGPAAVYAIVAMLALLSMHDLSMLQREDWRSVNQLLSRDARPGDGIVLWAPLSITPFEYAAHETSDVSPARVAYPNGPLIDDVDFPHPLPGFTRTLSQRFKRVWFIESHEQGGTESLGPFASLPRYYAHASEQFFPQIRGVMYSR